MTLSIIDKLCIALMSLTFFLISCEPDPCRSVFCYEGGECVDGICFCLSGQYGIDCSGSYSADVAGSFDVISICGTDSFFYTSDFTRATDMPWLIRISHPYHSVDDAVMMEGIFDSDGLMAIQDSTIIIDGDTVMLSGSSDIISNDSILLTMIYDIDTCFETYYR